MAGCLAGVLWLSAGRMEGRRWANSRWHGLSNLGTAAPVFQNLLCGRPIGHGDDNGPGTSSGRFARSARRRKSCSHGERVVIAAGTYRECIRPAQGGTGPAQMISYEAAPGATVIVTGSDTLNDGWQPSTAGSGRGGAAGAGAGGGGGGGGTIVRVETCAISAMFPDAYNPFAWLPCPAIGPGWTPRKSTWVRISAGGGLVFVNGIPLEPVSDTRTGQTRD